MGSFAFAGVCDEVDLSKHLPFLPETVKVVEKREVYSLCEMVLRDRGGYFTVYGAKDYDSREHDFNGHECIK